MHKIKIGTRTWKFRTSYGEFDCTNIKDYMDCHAAMDSAHDKYMAEYKSIKPLENQFIKELDPKKSKNLRMLIAQAKDNLADLQMKLHLARVEFLSICCYSSSFGKWAMETNGVDKEIIDTCLKAIVDKLSSFTDFWNNAPMVESFIFGNGFFKKKYKVHDLDVTTVYREMISNDIMARAMNHRSKLDEGYFDDIAKFVATIVRPAKEVEEISFTKKAFIKGKNVKGLNSSEKLDYYIGKLNEAVDKRADQFKKLPLSIAIGVIVCYFSKKKALEKSTSASTKAKKQP